MGTAVAIAVFAGILLLAATGVAASKGKSWLLEDLQMAANEKLLFDDEKASFGVLGYQRAAHNWVPMLAGKVRVTNQRLIVSQKGPFSKSDCIRYVVYYGSNPIPDSEKSGFPYVSFRNDNSRNQVVENKLRLFPTEQSTILPSYLEIGSPKLSEYLPVLGCPNGSPATPE